MKKPNLIVVIITFSFVLNAETSVRFCGNLSILETSNAQLVPGFSVALSKQWNIYKDFGLGGEIGFSQRNAYCKNKTFVSWGMEQIINNIYYTNHSISKHSLDIPLYVFKKLLLRNRIWQFIIRYSISTDFSGETNIKVTDSRPFSELSVEDQKSFKADYESIGDLDIIGSGHQSFQFGLSARLSDNKFLNILFIRSYIKRVQSVYYKEYLDTIEIGIGFILFTKAIQ
ncbi:hypothetical protein JW948_03775 [bacterium]|nr:hypothetical protein [bacterium]